MESKFGPVPMTIGVRSGETFTDWQPGLRIKTFYFLDGSSETQVLGRDVLQLTCRVRFDSKENVGAFERLMGTRQTLRMLEAATAFIGDRSFQEFGELYTEFNNVLLASVQDVRLLIGGQVEAQATFERRPR